MRILFFSHYFPPEGNAPASRVSALAQHWVNAGHEVTVITCVPNVPNGVPYEGYKNKLWQVEDWKGVRVVRVWTFLAPNKGTVKRTLNYVSYMFTAFLAGLFVKRPDIIVATSPQFFCGWGGALAAKFRRRPMILEIRDIWPESIQAVGAVQNRMALKILAWLEHGLYKSAKHIVTVGEGYRQKLLERQVPAEKMTIISNGVDRDQFTLREASPALKAKYGLEGAYVCSYIGTVGMAAGLEVVLRAATKLKAAKRNDIKFLIVGDGAALESLKTAAAQAGLDNVVFTGRQPKETMPDYLATTDVCLVHLKKQDLFTTVMPSKIFEALAMVRPVILGVKGFAAEFLQRSGGGVCIEPEDEDALLAELEKMRANPAAAKAEAGKGREFVMKNFDRGVLAQQYLQLLERQAKN